MILGFPRTGQELNPPWQRRRDNPAFSMRGMLATAHPLATAAGLRILQGGGNAVDAAVAAALASSVVLPAMCGIGGDLFAIVSRASDGCGPGEIQAIYGSGIGPRGVTVDFFREHGEAGGKLMPRTGPLSVAVPGLVDACFTLLRRFGTRTFADVAADAIDYANRGFPLSAYGARRIADVADLLAQYPTSAAIFLPGGRPPAPGTVLKQSDLARTLQQIAEDGPDVFYRGDLARRISAFLAAHGGVLSADDFADHQTAVSAPISTTYRGYRIYETGLPTQGFLVLEALNIIEGDDLATLGVTSADGVHLLAETMKLAFADRNRYAGDPAFVQTPLAALIGKPWAQERRKKIDRAHAAERVDPGVLSAGDTTYLCVADQNGTMVSLILSLSSGFGSGVVAGDTGIVLNNRAGDCFSLEEGHPNMFEPGKKTMHTLNCYLIAAPDGTPLIVGGTPGGDSQPQWNLQVITGLIDGGLDVQAAAEQPRWSVWPGTYPHDLGHPFELRIEERFGDSVLADLERRGHRVVRLGPWGSGGAVQLIARDPETGAMAGGSDPRQEGLAIGF